jgi:hypothetical protein
MPQEKDVRQVELVIQQECPDSQDPKPRTPAAMGAVQEQGLSHHHEHHADEPYGGLDPPPKRSERDHNHKQDNREPAESSISPYADCHETVAFFCAVQRPRSAAGTAPGAN